MTNNANIDEIVFDTKTLNWEIALNIKGEQIRFEITANTATNLIDAQKQGDDNKVRVNSHPQSNKVYFELLK